MTIEEVRKALQKEYKDDAPEHRDMMIRFFIGEIEKGSMKAHMIDGEVCYEMIYMPKGPAAEA